MSNARILVQYASRSRPERFFEGLRNIYALAADKKNIIVHSCLDADDATMFRRSEDPARMYEAMPHIQTEINLVSEIEDAWIDWDLGFSKSKIDAINRPFNYDVMGPWDILVNFSDDMRFTAYGWDELIREGVRINGPDCFLHYPDSTAKTALATMSIMDNVYYNRDGYIYHPDYQSLFCDNEAMEVAQIRGRYFYMGVQIYDHYHPAYGHVPWDEQYTRQQGLWNEDELRYRYRKLNNYFLDVVKHIDSDSDGTNGAIQETTSVPSEHPGPGGFE